MMGAEEVPATRADIAELKDMIGDLRRDMDQRFDQVDQRSDQVDQRFDQVDRQFDQVDRQFGDLRQGQASIREELGTMMSKKDLAVLRAELKAEVATEVGNVIKFDRERGGLA
jgi:septal ring factor EnvC (AmiA/AmiB activator)